VSSNLGGLVTRAARLVKRSAVRARRQWQSEVPTPPPHLDRLNHWEVVNHHFAEAMLTGGSALRPNYMWCLLHVANIARTLRIPRFSAVELGVAGGNGLLAMEAAASQVQRRLGIEVEVHGFDTGRGLPTPKGHTDAPFYQSAGDFSMDEQRLRARLQSARLWLGPVAETIPEFLVADVAPVGFAAYDLDLHSATIDALALLLGPAERLFPRVLCYFDDVLGYPWCDVLGERLAIIEHNRAHTDRPVAQLPGMRYLIPVDHAQSRWTDALYLAHAFDHPRYADDEGTALVRRLDLV
jgi:hypothetical protein